MRILQSLPRSRSVWEMSGKYLHINFPTEEAVHKHMGELLSEMGRRGWDAKGISTEQSGCNVTVVLQKRP